MNKKKIIIACILLICLLLSQFSAIAEETLPVVGAPMGTLEAEPETLPEEETEVSHSITEDSSEPQVAEESEEVVDPALSQVYEYLKLREQASDQQVVGVINEHTGPGERSGSNYEAQLLRNMRLRKLAELSEMNIIVFRSSGYVNVRSEATAASEAVGLMRNNATAEVINSVYSEDGLWYQIRSGSVEGYVKAEFFESGAQAADIISSIVRCFASVKNDAQRLYREESTDSDTQAILYSGEKYLVESWNDDYVCIQYAYGEYGMNYGYVPRSEVTLNWETLKATTIEAERRSLEESNRIFYENSLADRSREESRLESIRAWEESSIQESIRQSLADYQASIEASLQAEADESRREEASRQAEYESYLAESRWLEASAESSRQAASRWAEEQSAIAETSSSREQQRIDNGDLTRYIPEGTSDFRRRVVTNALQYVDVLPYIWGGYSLVTGTDCSGFLSLIFAQYGIELAHYSYYIAYTGVKVISIDHARPGDIVCWRTWSEGSGQGHVAMYIGRNEYGQPMIVEAPREGLKVRVQVMPTDDLHTIQNVIGD
ncbi:MAG: C40 family peptidase [Lachnospiraceae bacterium]|nr:C40 family peptidase [Lachnospiraceae bacterium]